MRAVFFFFVALAAGPLPATAFDLDTDLSTSSASFLGEDALDYAGWSVASGGDVNNDGFGDFLIGAYLNDEAGSNAGQTYLVLGKDSGWAMDISLANVEAR